MYYKIFDEADVTSPVQYLFLPYVSIASILD